MARSDQVMAEKLSYFGGYSVVPTTWNLRRGKVRDIVSGEVFVYEAWMQDPWLLIGMAIRRSPWFFVPKYLLRPFKYRSEANPLVTRTILQNWRYSPPFAWYQFGHEIKAARHAVFFKLLKIIGIDIEQPVRFDGEHDFNPVAHWIFGILKPSASRLPKARRQWSEQEAIDDLLSMGQAHALNTADIAQQYYFPAKYVEEVLIPNIDSIRSVPSSRYYEPFVLQ